MRFFPSVFVCTALILNIKSSYFFFLSFFVVVMNRKISKTYWEFRIWLQRFRETGERAAWPSIVFTSDVSFNYSLQHNESRWNEANTWTLGQLNLFGTYDTVYPVPVMFKVVACTMNMPYVQCASFHWFLQLNHLRLDTQWAHVTNIHVWTFFDFCFEIDCQANENAFLMWCDEWSGADMHKMLILYFAFDSIKYAI